LEITLRIDGQEKTFVTDFVSARMFRKTLEIGKQLDNGVTDPQDLDKVVDYVVDLFGKQFTRDNFYDGLPANKLVSTVVSMANGIISESNEKLGVDDPNS